MNRTPAILISNEGGNALVEMALVLPVLATLLVGTVDISRAYSNRLSLEQAAQRTIERMQRVDYSEADKNSYRNEAATAAGVSVSAVAVDSWRECSGTVRSFDYVCAAGEVGARYVRVTITGKYSPLFTSSIFPNKNADGTVTLTAKAGLRVQ